MKYRQLRVAVIDPISLAGVDLRLLLKQRAFPASRVLLYHSSPVAEALIAEADGEAAFIQPLAEGDLEDAQIVFLCGTAGQSNSVLDKHARDQATFVCLSPAPVASLVWLHGPKVDSRLLRLPHPAAYVLAEVFRALELAGISARPSGISVVIDRPVSELGKEGLDEMFQQAIAMASFKPLPKKLLEFQAAFNIFYPEDSEDFEKEIGQDFCAMLPGLPVPTVLSARAGVFHGHHLRVEIRYPDAAPALKQVLDAFSAKDSGFDVRTFDDGAGVIDAAGQDDILVLRAAGSQGSIRLALACDHLRQPLALQAIRLAEQIVADEGLLADA
jgi:aspartate-semialdehyde dehydrogenase